MKLVGGQSGFLTARPSLYAWPYLRLMLATPYRVGLKVTEDLYRAMKAAMSVGDYGGVDSVDQESIETALS